MNSFFLDASALAKRYASEVGTTLVNHLFTRVTPDRFYVFNPYSQNYFWIDKKAVDPVTKPDVLSKDRT